MRRPLCMLLITSCLVLLSRPALAQQKAAADRAFHEGRRLLLEGDVAAACVQFEESLKLMVQLSVRVNLADCYERQGKWIAARALLEKAEAAASRAGDRRVTLIRDRIAALDARMPKLTLQVAAGANVSGLQINLDDAPIERALLGAGQPIDPGHHTVEASAPGRLSWSTTVVAAAQGRYTVELPVLREQPKPVPTAASASAAHPARTELTVRRPAPSDASEQDPHRNLRYIGLGLGAAGTAALATGLFFGARAASKWSDAKADGHCTDDGICDDVGYPIARDARRAATTSTILVGAGLATASTGVLIYLWARRRGSSPRAVEQVKLTPFIGPEQTGLVVTGSY